jgi:myo-inositol catabolism protein IolC
LTVHDVLGYSDPILMLAFDHRDYFESFFGSDGGPANPQEISAAKQMIFEGALAAARSRPEQHAAGVLGIFVDERYGRAIARQAKQQGLRLAMPVERPGSPELDFEFGAGFGEHVERFDPDFSKVLLGHNPDDDAGRKQRQVARLCELADWLHARGRRFLLELIVPPSAAQLDSVAGDAARHQRELRPGLTLRAIAELQAAGVEPDVWKLEPPASADEAAALVRQARRDGREAVACVVLGAGQDAESIGRCVGDAAQTPGFAGFAIGRTIWGEAVGELASGRPAEECVERVASNYVSFVDRYTAAVTQLLAG